MFNIKGLFWSNLSQNYILNSTANRSLTCLHVNKFLHNFKSAVNPPPLVYTYKLYDKINNKLKNIVKLFSLHRINNCVAAAVFIRSIIHLSLGM